MQNIVTNFKSIYVGGRCIYDVNHIWELDKDSCDFVDFSLDFYNDIFMLVGSDASYLDIKLPHNISADKYYKLDIICCFATKPESPSIYIEWFNLSHLGSEFTTSFTIDVGSKGHQFNIYTVDLRKYTGWKETITNIRIYFKNAFGLVLLQYARLYSDIYDCSNIACPYITMYKHPCVGQEYEISLTSSVIDAGTISINDNIFNIIINDVLFKYSLNGYNYTLDNVVDELNLFLDSLQFGYVVFKYHDNKVVLKSSCSIELVCCDVLVSLGFFDDDCSSIYDTNITDRYDSYYIDVAGNLAGEYTYDTDIKIDLELQPDVGIITTSSTYPTTVVSFLGNTILPKICVVERYGVYNKFTMLGKTYTGSKILIYRRYGDHYNLIYSIDMPDDYEGTVEINHRVVLNKGDIIGMFNVKIVMPKYVDIPINYYYTSPGILTHINVDSIDGLVASPVGIYVELDYEPSNDVDIKLLPSVPIYIDSMYLYTDSSDYHDIDVSRFLYTDNIELFLECVEGDSTIEIQDDEFKLDVILNYISNDCNKFMPLDLSVVYVNHTGMPIHKVDVNLALPFYRNYVEYVKLFECNGECCFLKDFDLSESVSKELDTSPLSGRLTNFSYSDSNSLESSVGLDYPTSSDLAIKLISCCEFEYTDVDTVIFSMSINSYTKVPGILDSIIKVDIAGDGIIIDSGYNILGYTTDVLSINIKPFSSIIKFDGLKIVSSRTPEYYFVTDGYNYLTLYNTKPDSMHCSILDIVDAAYLITITDLHFPSDGDYTVYKHHMYGLYTSSFDYNKNISYRLISLLDNNNFYMEDLYTFKDVEYDWFVPYDYNLASYDGVFKYINNKVVVIPNTDLSIRWYNFINSNIYSGDIIVELSFSFVGNISDYSLVGITINSISGLNLARFYVVFTKGTGYGIEYEYDGDDESTILFYDSKFGLDHTIKVVRQQGKFSLYAVVGDKSNYISSIPAFEDDIYVAISVLYKGDSFVGNDLISLNKCVINYSFKKYGVRSYYSLDDINSVVYNGYITDSIKPINNISNYLLIPGNVTINKFIYKFEVLKTRFIKLVSTSSHSIKITEIMAYLGDVMVPVSNCYVSYNCDYTNGSLESEAVYLNDGCIINADLGYTITLNEGSLCSVGISFDSLTEIDRLNVYYVDTSDVSSPRLLHSYDNSIYYDVYDNYQLYNVDTFTRLHFLFNDYSGYSNLNTVRYKYTSENDFDTYFDVEGLSDKWHHHNTAVDTDGLLVDNGYITSKFYVDGDFDIDVFYTDLSNLSDSSYVYVYVYFGNNTSYGYTYVGHRINYRYIYYRYGGYVYSTHRSKLRTYEGGLRLSRRGNTLYWKYREGMSTWVSVSGRDYGSDYKYPVYIKVRTVNCSAVIKNVVVSLGKGVGEEDAILLESYYDNAVFVRGANLPTTNTTSSVNIVNDSLCYLTPNSFLSFIYYIRENPTNYETIFSKHFNFDITSVNRYLYLSFHYDYTVFLNTDLLQILGENTNSFISLSIGSNDLDSNLLQTPGPRTELSYNSGVYGDAIFDEIFEYTYDDLVLDGSGSFVDLNVFKLRFSAALKCDIPITSTRGLYVEASITYYTFYRYSDYYRAIIVVSSQSSNYPTYTNQSVYIVNIGNSSEVRVYINGYNRGKLLNLKLNYTYLFSIRFLNGKVVVSYNGPSKGSKVYDCSNLEGDVYIWTGSAKGHDTGNNEEYFYIHRFLCMRYYDYADVIYDSYLHNTILSDDFTGSDNRLPSSSRWYIEGNPRTQNTQLRMSSATYDIIKTVYSLDGTYTIDIKYNNLSYSLSPYSGLKIELINQDYIFTDIVNQVDYIFIGFVSEDGIELFINNNTYFYNSYNINSGIIRVVRTVTTLDIYFYTGGSFDLLQSVIIDRGLHTVSINAIGDGTTVFVDYFHVDCDDVRSPLSPTTVLQLGPYADQRFSYRSNMRYSSVNLARVINDSNTYNINFNVFNVSQLWWIMGLYTPPSSFNPNNKITTIQDLLQAFKSGGVYYIYSGDYDISNSNIESDIILIGVGNFNDIVLNTHSYVQVNSNVRLYLYNIRYVNYLTNNYSGYGLTLNGNNTVVWYNCYYECPYYAPAIGATGSNSYIHIINSRFRNVSYLIRDYVTCYFNVIRATLQMYRFSYYNRSSSNFDLYKTSYDEDYAPKVTDKIIIWLCLSDRGGSKVYLSVVDEVIELDFNIDTYEFISIGNNLANMYLYSTATRFYFFDSRIDSSYENGEVVYNAIIDTIQFDSTYVRSNDAYALIDWVKDSAIKCNMFYNGSTYPFKLYYLNSKGTNSLLSVGKAVNGLLDELVYDTTYRDSDYVNILYNDFVSKFDYSGYTITTHDCKCRYYIDLGSPKGIANIVYRENPSFSSIIFYGDDIDDPLLLTNITTQDECRWVVMEDVIGGSDNKPGVMSMFPSINSKNSFEYIGIDGMEDLLPNCVITTSNLCITPIYNIIFSYKTSYDDYAIVFLDNTINIDISYYKPYTPSKLIIKSGIRTSHGYEGYITKLSIFSAGQEIITNDYVNSKIELDITLIDITTLTIVIHSVKPISGIIVDGSYIEGNYCFIEYMVMLIDKLVFDFNKSIGYGLDILRTFDISSINLDSNCTQLQTYNKCVPFNDITYDFNSIDMDTYNGCCRSLVFYMDTYTECEINYNSVGVDVEVNKVCSVEDTWYISKGDADIIYTRFYAEYGNTGSIGVTLYKDTDFELTTYTIQKVVLTDIGVTDVVRVVTNSQKSIDNMYFRIGTGDIYFKWHITIPSGRTEFLLTQFDDFLDKISYGKVDANLKLNEIDITEVGLGGNVNIDTNVDVYLSSVDIIPHLDEYVLSSHLDGLEIPIGVVTSYFDVNLSFESYWNSKGMVYGYYGVDKVILSLTSDDFKMSVINKSYGSFKLSVVCESIGYKDNVTALSPISINVGDICNMNVIVKVVNKHILVNVIINGAVLFRYKFNDKLYTDNIFISKIVIGGGFAYTHPQPMPVSLCGKVLSISASTSKGTEANVELDSILVDVGNGFEPLIGLLPLDLGVIPSGGKSELPIKLKSKNTRFNLNVLWSINR